MNEIMEQLRDKKSQNRRSAAKKLRKLKDINAGPYLLDALENELNDGVVRPFQRKVQSYSVGLSLQGLQKGVCFSLE